MNSDLVIFLAEDNQGDVFLVDQALRKYGLVYRLIIASDGDTATELVERIGRDLPCPDLLLLDVNLPKCDGGEVLAAFRRNPLCEHTPVIVVTSSDSPRDRARLADLEVAGYFRKPSDLDQFMELGALVRSVTNR